MEDYKRLVASKMDIDNGPMMLTYNTNGLAYTNSFYHSIKKRLNKLGVFFVWSGNEDQMLLAGLKEVFGNCKVEKVSENHFGKEVPYYLYTARNS